MKTIKDTVRDSNWKLSKYVNWSSILQKNCFVDSVSGLSNVHSVVVSVKDVVEDSVRVSIGSSISMFVRERLQ